MLGYTNSKQALAEGYTHHGHYFGIPVWIGEPDGEFRVKVKHVLLEHVMDAATCVEAFLRGVFRPDDPPGFQFRLGSEIEP